MRTAVFADIHANREAFEACLGHARERAVENIVLLGDYVGYGADPDWTTETVMSLVSDGAIAVLGNHDCAVKDESVSLNIEAKIVIEWTRRELGLAQRRFLAQLPLSHFDEDVLYVHADASSPRNWNYVTGPTEAARSLNATNARVTFCGHVHRPAIYSMAPTAKLTAFKPVTGVPIQLLSRRRWLVVAGSVGQPRDGNPAASYVLFDTKMQEVTFHRVPYDIERAAEKIREKQLPSSLADRLSRGR